MHIAFLTNPASGQANVQLATAQELVQRGHQATFLSGSSFASKVNRLCRQQTDSATASRISFVDLGSEPAMEDFTPRIQKAIGDLTLRRVPGDAKSLQTCIEIAAVTADEHYAAAILVRDEIRRVDPDLIVVDALSPILITGTRLTRRKWVMTVPCSPGTTSVGGHFEPHPMAANRSGGWGTLLENAYLRSCDYLHHSRNELMTTKRSLLCDRLGLKSFGICADTGLLPPLWEDADCIGGIHFNVFGLTDCLKQPPNFVFVGAGISHEQESKAARSQCDTTRWMDAALGLGEDVIYINMGSMFIWQEAEFWPFVAALQNVWALRQGKVRFLFKINKPLAGNGNADFLSHASKTVPDYIRITTWIDSQQSVYQHPALAAFVHHGGGNSFNEAVFYGIPQLVLSQWLDTHELASLAEQFGIGLRSIRPPRIEKDDVQAKLLKLLSEESRDTFRIEAKAWALRSKLGGGAAAAAEILECHASNYSPHRTLVSTPVLEKKNALFVLPPPTVELI